jgi:hypothetical protein
MRIFAGFSMALCFAGTMLGQYHIGAPIGPGNALFPAGTAATNPNITRFTPNAVRPASGVPHPVRRGPITTGTGAVVVPYAYPVYYGGDYTDGSYAQTPNAAQQPNVTVVYPPQPAPVIINQFGPGVMPPSVASMAPPSPYQNQTSTDRPDDQTAADRYLIALKDHTIYSVVAYWVEGDTLHYFTAGNVHNQASLSLVDRALTARLNKESGTEVELPAAK